VVPSLFVVFASFDPTVERFCSNPADFVDEAQLVHMAVFFDIKGAGVDVAAEGVGIAIVHGLIRNGQILSVSRSCRLTACHSGQLPKYPSRSAAAIERPRQR